MYVKITITIICNNRALIYTIRLKPIILIYSDEYYWQKLAEDGGTSHRNEQNTAKLNKQYNNKHNTIINFRKQTFCVHKNSNITKTY